MKAIRRLVPGHGFLPDPLLDALDPPKQDLPETGKPDEAPTRGDSEVIDAGAGARREARQRRGRRATVLSNRRGKSKAKLGRRSVLGG